jgi:hypothetical protein
MTAVRRLPQRMLAEVRVGPDLVRVSVAEGDVSMVWTLHPPLPGGSALWMNRFARRETAAELRALADVLDGLNWIDDATVGGQA